MRGDDHSFPIGVQVARGRWTIRESLAGTQDRGVYRASGPALVAMALQVEPSARRDAWTSLSPPYPIAGIAQLLAIDEITFAPDELTYDVLVAAEPYGAPLTKYRPPRVRALGADLATIVARAHAAGYVMGSIRPECVYAEGDTCTGIVPFIERFHAIGRSPCFGVGPAYASMYMSPERARGTAITAASDVFCLCATLAYLFGGSPPFGDESLLAQLEAILAGQLRPMILPAIVRAGLEPDAHRRPSSAAIAAALARPS